MYSFLCDLNVQWTRLYVAENECIICPKSIFFKKTKQCIVYASDILLGERILYKVVLLRISEDDGRKTGEALSS